MIGPHKHTKLLCSQHFTYLRRCSLVTVVVVVTLHYTYTYTHDNGNNDGDKKGEGGGEEREAGNPSDVVM